MRPRARAALATATAVAACAGFTALGVWQLERRAWKHDLIARVEARVHAPPVAAPEPATWPQLSAARDEYRRVRLSGIFLHEHETLTQATTVLGAGYWVLTPLRQSDGTIVFVNRGFVEPRFRDQASRASADPTGETEVIGLLRLSELGGGFLRRNDAAADRWHSRDVAAIAASRGLANVAPFFVDAERAGTDGPQGTPVGGLTVVTFTDSHLGYAVTWFVLAAMAVTAVFVVIHTELRAGRVSFEEAKQGVRQPQTEGADQLPND